MHTHHMEESHHDNNNMATILLFKATVTIMIQFFLYNKTLPAHSTSPISRRYICFFFILTHMYSNVLCDLRQQTVVCFLVWAFLSVPLLVWCLGGFPLSRVAPLDWWGWQFSCTNRQVVIYSHWCFSGLSRSPAFTIRRRHLLMFINTCNFHRSLLVMIARFKCVPRCQGGGGKAPNEFRIYSFSPLLWQQNCWYQSLKTWNNPSRMFRMKDLFCFYTCVVARF